MINGLHIYSAFLTGGHSKCFTMLPNIHTFTRRRPWYPRRTTASSPGAVRARRCSGTPRHSEEPGIEPPTSWLAANLLNLPQPHAAPDDDDDHNVKAGCVLAWWIVREDHVPRARKPSSAAELISVYTCPVFAVLSAAAAENDSLSNQWNRLLDSTNRLPWKQASATLP